MTTERRHRPVRHAGTVVGRAFATDVVEVRLPFTDAQLASLGLPIGYTARDGDDARDRRPLRRRRRHAATLARPPRSPRRGHRSDHPPRLRHRRGRGSLRRGAADGDMPLAVGLYVERRDRWPPGRRCTRHSPRRAARRQSGIRGGRRRPARDPPRRRRSQHRRKRRSSTRACMPGRAGRRVVASATRSRACACTPSSTEHGLGGRRDAATRVSGERTEMDRLIAWWANNPIAANLLMVGILLAGLLGFQAMEREAFPVFRTNRSPSRCPGPAQRRRRSRSRSSHAHRAGADQSRDVRLVYGTAEEGFGRLEVYTYPSIGIDQFLDEVKNTVDSVTSLPRDIEPPRVTRIQYRSEMIRVAVHGDLPERSSTASPRRCATRCRRCPCVDRRALRHAARRRSASRCRKTRCGAGDSPSRTSPTRCAAPP